MNTHIYLDDIRAPPDCWTLVKTYDECITALRSGVVEYDMWPKVSITLHTGNPVGRINTRKLSMRYKPDHVKVYG